MKKVNRENVDDMLANHGQVVEILAPLGYTRLSAGAFLANCNESELRQLAPIAKKICDQLAKPRPEEPDKAKEFEQTVYDYQGEAVEVLNTIRTRLSEEQKAEVDAPKVPPTPPQTPENETVTEN